MIQSKPESISSLPARVLNLVDSGVIVLDHEGRIALWNGWLVPRSGRGAARMLGHALIEVFPDLRGSRVEAAIFAALLEGVATEHVPLSHSRAPFPLREPGSFDGALMDQAVSVTPFDEDGRRFCLVEIRDVSSVAVRERRLLEHAESLRARSYIDGLTGIANRRHFDVALERELRRAQRADGTLALLLVDIDSFKAYNDHFGHQQGDSCLTMVAQELAGMLKRPADLAARYGGEEFAAVLPDTTLEQARVLADRIRAHVAGLGLQQAPAAHHPQVTLSIGVAAFDRARLNAPEVLIEAADKALYAAKRGGRNRVVADGDAVDAAA
ncbi:diguanylate cyclase [Massilia sp. CFBP9012]|uniref:sensor domain-containing diguanylate cyclase n=1 Tax=Massilia sp. CFBP9012 TaxID=3096531 RepID=UPI002A6B62F5|nr:diguanylate cyclase [Massilia sp. CFBP9012]MDY0977127.1 diguanylate cyclase [Massilia sp. CFBP9012]